MKSSGVGCSLLVSLLLAGAPALAGTQTGSIEQVAVYRGATRHQLFEIYANAEKHSAATHKASGQVAFVNPATGERHSEAKVGLELHGFHSPDGTPRLVGKVLEIQKGERIVLEWINSAWKLAIDPSEISNLPSIVTLEFHDNTVGAEIVLTQINVPAYQVSMPSSPFSPKGEVGPLVEIVRVHWELTYWQPIRRYLSNGLPAN